MSDIQTFSESEDGVYKMVGMLDLGTVAGWKERGVDILEKAQEGVRFDLANAEVKGSAAIVLLIALKREGERMEKQVEFTNCSEELQSMARVCGVQDILWHGDTHES
ncbi:MAG: STAS domain-containing protein [Pseudomonadales bacterium]